MVLNKPKSINHMNHVFDVVLFIIYFLLQDKQKNKFEFIVSHIWELW